MEPGEWRVIWESKNRMRTTKRLGAAMQFTQSRTEWTLAQNHIPAGVSSSARLREQPWPLFFESADGPYIYDVDGNRLVDYALGNGPMLLGHRPRPVIEAVIRQLDAGLLYAGQHRLESQVAELLVQTVPCAEKVLFSQTGTEAILAALRIARGATGRQKVLKFQGHYHGWADGLFYNVDAGDLSLSVDGLVETAPASGGQQLCVGSDVLVTIWNDIEAFKAVMNHHGAELAAVIMEPIMQAGVILPRPGYLELVRELCDRHGIPLIFDEIVTGYRFGLHGAQGMLGVTPDLAVFGKAMASGFPVSVVVGRNDLFDGVSNGSVVHSGTYNAYPVGMAAAAATIRHLADPNEGAYDILHARGTKLLEGLQSIATDSSRPILVQGAPAMMFLAFTDATQLFDSRDLARVDARLGQLFRRSLVESGVRAHGRGGFLLSTAHSEEDIAETLSACVVALGRLVEKSGAN
jgi:glutamate-1-semialdehyde 2,1-aminomutase